MDVESYVLAKNYTDSAIGSVPKAFHYCGEVATRANLPGSPSDGDVYTIKNEDYSEVAWSEEKGEWFGLGPDNIIRDVKVDGESVVTDGADGRTANIDLSGKVDKTTKIANIDLQDDISVSELKKNLGVDIIDGTFDAATAYDTYASQGIGSIYYFPKGIFRVPWDNITGLPTGCHNGLLMNLHISSNADNGYQVYFEYKASEVSGVYFRAVRKDWNDGYQYNPWSKIATNIEVAALETRVQALESALSGVVQRLEQI